MTETDHRTRAAEVRAMREDVSGLSYFSIPDFATELADALEALAKAEAENARLREAVTGLVPGHRDPLGMCWCAYGRNPDFGHDEACLRARAALKSR